MDWIVMVVFKVAALKQGESISKLKASPSSKNNIVLCFHSCNKNKYDIRYTISFPEHSLFISSPALIH